MWCRCDDGRTDCIYVGRARAATNHCPIDQPINQTVGQSIDPPGQPHHPIPRQSTINHTYSSRAAPLEAAERAATRRAQEALLQALVETGAKDQLLAQLRERLYDAGWLERVKEHIKGAYRVCRWAVLWERGGIRANDTHTSIP